jgi:hypothetical protein
MRNPASSPSAVVPFRFQSREIRALTIDDEPWFVAKDVCDVLDIEWKGSGTLRPLDDDEKAIQNIGYSGPGNPNVNIISEPDLYRLIAHSKKFLRKTDGMRYGGGVTERNVTGFSNPVQTADAPPPVFVWRFFASSIRLALSLGGSMQGGSSPPVCPSAGLLTCIMPPFLRLATQRGGQSHQDGGKP